MNCFYVYQNKTYNEEYRGGFIWSPKFASGGHKNAGYETMKEVKKGDVIIHSYQGKIVAIGIAESNCYSADRPNSAFDEWDIDGWKVDIIYYPLENPIKTSDYIEKLYELQPSKNGPYTCSLRGKQQYLCNANIDILNFVLEKISAQEKNSNVCDQIKNTLSI